MASVTEMGHICLAGLPALRPREAGSPFVEAAGEIHYNMFMHSLPQYAPQGSHMASGMRVCPWEVRLVLQWLLEASHQNHTSTGFLAQIS
jgi:hypothetical protein